MIYAKYIHIKVLKWFEVSPTDGSPNEPPNRPPNGPPNEPTNGPTKRPPKGPPNGPPVDDSGWQLNHFGPVGTDTF